MYLEFLILTFDYFKTLSRRTIIYEWLVPLIIAFACSFLGCIDDFKIFSTFKDSSINVLGVLLGFSIAVITIITTGGSKNIEEIKKSPTGIKIGEKEIFLYDLVLINFTYSVVLEILLIFSCLIMPLVNRLFLFGSTFKLALYSIMIFIVLHILLLTLRNITDFYLIISKKKSE
ncbi:hypothetical protein [Elizabethkingia anophelis]|uniref:hypothetical protein n=1 Tax=Elizabethkingia anophelis TaxID=1117645 RepID=UPI00038A292E|nr:hypothetical protein [Elizabethkingia anophelis]EQB91295.1 hypothetical protein C874_11905 [Elizabethkingia anophelis 502]